MKRTILIAALALSALLLRPTHVYACSGVLGFFGVCLDDISNRDAQRRENENALKEQGATERAQIEAERTRKITEADNQLKLQIANGQITIEQARIQASNYRAMLDANVQTQNALVIGQASQNIAALQAQAQIAVAGIQESGMTVRERLLLSTVHGLVVFALILFSGLLIFFLFTFVTSVTKRKPKMLDQPSYYNAPVQSLNQFQRKEEIQTSGTHD